VNARLNVSRVRDLLQEFKFHDLFIEELGWNIFKFEHAFEFNGRSFKVQGLAEKKGLAVLVCTSTESRQFPGSVERKRIVREVAKLYHELIIVFIDREPSRQTWAILKRDDGKAKGMSEISYFAGKGVEHLARRIQHLSFSLEESESITIVEVTRRVSQALLAERVTKKFFKEFSDQRKAFVKFLDWIEDEAKRDWYCSVLLNRLMFIYFLGGKGFLPGGTGFLTKNLAANTTANGADTFYTHFLLPLSFFGLGEMKTKRGRFEEMFKNVLYLDGGLFTVHQVELELGIDKEAVDKGTFPASTRIPDVEFRRWFDYFDKWRWTLDEDKVENDGYISPHILGYIFEKYINQKQMGAYYTKEDITGYICRNTIIPRLFDMLAETGEKGNKAVCPLPIGPHPNLLNDGRGISDGEGIDRYVYPSVKQEEKLPTETDYELEQRRTRCETILKDFDDQKLQRIDDFITYNLDIEKLALDFVSNIQDPEVLHAFYFKGLQQITVLDPTCGSGAFLFAALGILRPLYNACLSRMRYLVGKATGDEPDVVNWGGRLHFDDLDIDQSAFAGLVQSGGPGGEILDEFRTEVKRINDHPSAEYFIKKSIIVNNLFGVDIMEEAVEICKLRLFLTLIATVERDDAKPNMGVEPLPDIDFNILAGNTLVGYSSIADIDRLWQEVELQTVKSNDRTIQKQGGMAFEKDHSRLKRLCDEYAKVLQAWRLQQLGGWKGVPVSKDQVVRAAQEVRPELDEDLWRLYRTADFASTNENGKRGELGLRDFKRGHEPFHWLLEFPSIEAAGGFDVIVGNPPYVEYPSKSVSYGLPGYQTLSCGDLYAFVLERTHRSLARASGRLGFIVPISLVSTDGFNPLRTLLRSHSNSIWTSNYAERPAKLFSGVEKRLTVYLSAAGKQGHQFSSHYYRWLEEERQHLLQRVQYTQILRQHYLVGSSIPKASVPEEFRILDKLSRQGKRISDFLHPEGKHLIYYTRKLRYFVQVFDFVPRIEEEDGTARTPSELKLLQFHTEGQRDVVLALLNSSLFFWFFSLYSDVRNVNKRELLDFPVDLARIAAEDASGFHKLSQQLMASYEENSVIQNASYKGVGVLRIQSFRPRLSKPVMDRIDARLALHFGLTPEEEAFIVNFDLKYRAGQPDGDTSAGGDARKETFMAPEGPYGVGC